MELRAFDKDGKPVRAKISDLAESIRKGGEEVGAGRTPYHVVYSNRLTGEQHEVDMQEMAQAIGMKNVQFHFDPEQAREQGFLVDRDIDKGVAYNLERIKNDDLRRQYLKEKGYTNVLQFADDFYSYENGKLYPINNQFGLDMSDAIRLAAHAGRDIGSAVAVGATIGGGAVGSVFSGGATLAGGVAAAGVAGAAGAAVGETAQRVGDMVFGADAARFNEKLEMTEELGQIGREAAIGAVGGIAQPLMTAGGAKVAEGVIAPAARKFLGEWGERAAAKMEMGAAMTRLPQGAMQKFATKEQAVAQDILDEGGKLLRQRYLSPDNARKVTAEAQALARGQAKIPADSMEAVEQVAFQKLYKQQQIEAAHAARVEAEAAMAKEKVILAQARAELERGKDGVHRALSDHKKLIETILDPKSDLDASIAAQHKIMIERASKMGTPLGLKVMRGAQGEALGFENASMSKFIDKQFEGAMAESGKWLNSQRALPVFLSKPADPGVKGDVVDAIRASITQTDPAFLGGEAKAQMRELLKSVEKHGMLEKVEQGETLREAIERFHRFIIDVANNERMPKATREALESAFSAITRLEISATNDRVKVAGYYAGLNKLYSIKKELGVHRGAMDDETLQGLVGGLLELAKTAGDPDGVTVAPLVRGLHLDQIMQGKFAPKEYHYRGFIPPEERGGFDALDFIKRFPTESRRTLPSSGEKSKRFGAALAGGAAALAMGVDPLTGAIVGALGAHKMPSNVGTVAQGAIAAARKGGEIAGRAASAALSTGRKIERAVESKVPKKVIAAEELEEDQVRRVKSRRMRQFNAEALP